MVPWTTPCQLGLGIWNGAWLECGKIYYEMFMNALLSQLLGKTLIQMFPTMGTNTRTHMELGSNFCCCYCY